MITDCKYEHTILKHLNCTLRDNSLPWFAIACDDVGKLENHNLLMTNNMILVKMALLEVDIFWLHLLHIQDYF
jgi:hypothetical protein